MFSIACINKMEPYICISFNFITTKKQNQTSHNMRLSSILLATVCLLANGSAACKATTNTAAQACNQRQGAFYTGVYRNLFNEYLGISESKTDERLAQIWKHFFVDDETKVYFEDSDSTAYIYDTGSHDVRTEGMSYGMMICVQMDKRAEFDKIWRWAKTHMLYTSGRWQGYFAWQCNTDGSKIGGEPSCATDGEIYFITSLFFASHRWGDDGAYNYGREAQKILSDVMSKDGSQGVYNIFDAKTKLVCFVPHESLRLHTDPSYNLPAFFELWARWSDTNKDFWAHTPDAARDLLAASSHPVTGLFPDYSTFKGEPFQPDWKNDYDARRYQYDAIRCAMNIGMDYNWFGKDCKRQTDMMTRLLKFFKKDGFTHGQFNLDGTSPTGGYTEGMAGANAVGAFCLEDKALAKEYVERLWNTKAPTGEFRYYSGMVYMLSMLHVSGRFRIY